MASVAEDLLAFPDIRAARLAGVSVRRLRYWEESGLVVPSIKRNFSPRNTVRLYSYQDLLALLVVATLGGEVYFQHPDGSWEGDLRPDQIILVKTILLEPLRLRIDAAAQRTTDDIGRVTKRRGVHASAPIFAGTRIRLSTVQDYLRQGYGTQDILGAFPDLEPADIDEAGRLLAAAG